MSAYIPVELQRQVRRRFANCCAYCRTAEALTVRTFEFEHIVPRSAGGDSVLENLCLSFPSCNRYKAQRQTAVDPLTEETIALFHPQLQVWREHFAWEEEATIIAGLTPTGRATIKSLRMNRPQMVRVRSMWVKLGEHPPMLE
ncbi:MAG: HNH endonuclease [Coleofasciculaceae cyanobacterium SM2_3_26]|nr:HNH endonuclease [Coleofasciculaceae cyanobacterium SM2_3_26]